MGGTDSIEEGTFVWEHAGKPVAYNDWTIAQPDNENNQDCMAVYGLYGWDDMDCSKKLAFICETEPGVWHKYLIMVFKLTTEVCI